MADIYNRMKRLKTIAQLKKIFKEKDLTDCKDIPEVELMGYMDATNVIMVVPKTNIGQELLTTNFKLSKPQKIPELNYSNDTFPSSKYPIEYMKIILNFMESFGDDEMGVILTLSKDYPLSVDLKHFRIILAPRVEND